MALDKNIFTRVSLEGESGHYGVLQKVDGQVRVLGELAGDLGVEHGRHVAVHSEASTRAD